MEHEYGHISAVYVRAANRGKGLGSALVEATFRWFEEKRVSRVRVAADAKNALGVESWKHQGLSQPSQRWTGCSERGTLGRRWENSVNLVQG